MAGHDLIAIGTSAGGVEALAQLVRLLPSDLPAALIVVMHVPAHGTSALPQILNRAGSLHAVRAENGQLIQNGQPCAVEYGLSRFGVDPLCASEPCTKFLPVIHWHKDAERLACEISL